MPTFVLVHGAWHGGWCWKYVAGMLREKGNAVYSPTLTGQGERSHLASPQIGLTTQVLDICNAIKFEEIHDVILVGHSYGGMVVTGVAARMPERIAHVVYLDAIFPEEEQSAWDALPGFREECEALLSNSDTNWLIPPPNDKHPFGVKSEEDSKWVRRNLTPQPLMTLKEPLAFKPTHLKGLQRTFVYCRRRGGLFTPLAKRLRRDPSWRYEEIATGHDAMITEPLKVVRILTKL